jgi:hypothetical protein
MKMIKSTSMTSTIGVTFGAACTDDLIESSLFVEPHDAPPRLGLVHLEITAR